MTPSALALEPPAPEPPGLRCLLLEVGSAVVAILMFDLEVSALPARVLTAAEDRVVRAIFEGKSNGAIAQERGTSSRTVANQVASIFRKYGVASRAELVAHYLAPLSCLVTHEG